MQKRPEFLVLIAVALALATYLAVQQFILHAFSNHSLVHGLYDPSRALLELLRLGGIASAFALGFRVSQDDAAAKRLLRGIITVGAAWAALSIIMFTLDPDGVYGVVKVAAKGRLTGAFSSANSAATLFGSNSLLSLGRVLDRFWKIRARSVVERLDPYYVFCWVISLTALMLTVSRTGIAITLVLSFCILVAIGWRRLSIKSLVAACAAGTLVVFGLLLSPLDKYLQRATAFDMDSHQRLRIYNAHWEVAIHQPWFGAGLGSFNAINRSIATELNYVDLSFIRAAHNVYLQWFEECGLFGLFLLVTINVAILIPLYRSLRQRQSMWGKIQIIMFAYSLFLMHGLTDFGLQEPALQLFIAMLLGCGFAMATNSNRVNG